MVKTKEELQVEQQILYNLVRVVETFPQYTLSQHMWHILRTKGDKDPYFWSNVLLLSKVQDYYNELNTDLAYGTDTEWGD